MMAYRNAGRRDDALRIQEALDRLQSAEDGEFSEFLRALARRREPRPCPAARGRGAPCRRQRGTGVDNPLR